MPGRRRPRALTLGRAACSGDRERGRSRCQRSDPVPEPRGMAGESLRRPRHSERFDGRSEWTEAVMQARRCGLAATFALALPVALGAGAPASAAPVAGPLFRDPGGACVRTPPTIPTGARTRLSDVLGGAFVENRGQVAAPVEFYLPVGRDRVWVAPRELVFDQSSRRRGGRVERLRFTQRLVGARTGARRRPPEPSRPGELRAARPPRRVRVPLRRGRAEGRVARHRRPPARARRRPGAGLPRPAGRRPAACARGVSRHSRTAGRP